MFFITEKNSPPTILPPSATHARLLDLKRHLRGLLRLCGALTQHGLDDLLLLDQERADDAVDTTKWETTGMKRFEVNQHVTREIDAKSDREKCDRRECCGSSDGDACFRCFRHCCLPLEKNGLDIIRKYATAHSRRQQKSLTVTDKSTRRRN